MFAYFSALFFPFSSFSVNPMQILVLAKYGGPQVQQSKRLILYYDNILRNKIPSSANQEN